MAAAQSTITQILPAAQQGCSRDFECSLQSISTDCSPVCFEPILTNSADTIAVQITKVNQQYCDNTTFKSICSKAKTQAAKLTCSERVAFCDLSGKTGVCSARAKLVASATEIGSGPPGAMVAGIGSNPNGVDNVVRDPVTGIYQAISTIPIPTTNNVGNVVSNIPLPQGAPPLVGISTTTTGGR
jgi:hypothetical protein